MTRPDPFSRGHAKCSFPGCEGQAVHAETKLVDNEGIEIYSCTDLGHVVWVRAFIASAYSVRGYRSKFTDEWLCTLGGTFDVARARQAEQEAHDTAARYSERKLTAKRLEHRRELMYRLIVAMPLGEFVDSSSFYAKRLRDTVDAIERHFPELF